MTEDRVIVYEVHFIFDGDEYHTDLPHGIGDIELGFWVNAAMRYAVASEVRYWIPISQILYVRKDKVRPG